MIYVTLPESFIAIKYPGYFWNIDDQKLYSLKVGGVLKEMRLNRPNYYNHMKDKFYTISVNGKRKNITVGYLEYHDLKKTIIPIK